MTIKSHHFVVSTLYSWSNSWLLLSINCWRLTLRIVIKTKMLFKKKIVRYRNLFFPSIQSSERCFMKFCCGKEWKTLNSIFCMKLCRQSLVCFYPKKTFIRRDVCVDRFLLVAFYITRFVVLHRHNIIISNGHNKNTADC